MDPTTTAIGTWSGGRFMHFGEPLPDERLLALLRPGDGIDTVMSADTYGAGAADRLLGGALRGVQRERYCLVGAIGHDFYKGERDGAKGFPRFTDPRLRGEEEYAVLHPDGDRAQPRAARRRAVRPAAAAQPGPHGYSSPAVWEGMAAVREAGLTGCWAWPRDPRTASRST